MGNSANSEERNRETAIVNDKAKATCKVLNLDRSAISYTTDTNFNNYTAEIITNIENIKISVRLVDQYCDSLTFILKNSQIEMLGAKITALWPYLYEISKHDW